MPGFISRTNRVLPDSFTNLTSTGERPQSKNERHANPTATGVKEPKSPSASPLTGSDRRSKTMNSITPISRLANFINRCGRSSLDISRSCLWSASRHLPYKPSFLISHHRSSIGRLRRFFHVSRIFGVSTTLRLLKSSKAALCAYNHQ